MSTSWVAGSVRGVSLSRRRLGAAGARALAAGPDLGTALTTLAATPYGHDVRIGQSLAEAQHAVGATLLWHLRVLAGWQPREGADVVRVLARGFELANVEELMARLAGLAADPAYHLGTLQTTWNRLAGLSSPAEVRDVLTTSAWALGDASTPRRLGMGLRLAWADRVIGVVPEAAGWARAATALLLVRETLVDGHGLSDDLVLRAGYVVGPRFVTALASGSDLPVLGRALPSDARWAFRDIDDVGELWRAEAMWWRRVEHDGFVLLRRSGFDRAVAVGAAAVLAVDAWRVRAALEAAARAPLARGGISVLEAFDAVA